MTVEEKLRLQFRKFLRKGTCHNATLDPIPSPVLLPALAEGEVAVVRVDASNGTCYWFTSTRVWQESDSEVYELLCYADVREAAWMFRSRDKMCRSMLNPNWTKIKTSYGDRVELQLSDGKEITLSALGQAYVPALNFFQKLP